MLSSLTGKFHALIDPAESPQLATLHSISLFHQITRRDLRAISDYLHSRTYKKNEIIFDQGEEGQAIYFIIEGKVLICRQGQPLDGAIVILSVGECFGEMALLDNAPRMAQVRAYEDCTLDVMFREDFLKLSQTHPRIASKLYLRLARMMAERLRQSVNYNVL
jgi:CRP-like cAMP-binding protein